MIIFISGKSVSPSGNRKTVPRSTSSPSLMSITETPSVQRSENKNLIIREDKSESSFDVAINEEYIIHLTLAALFLERFKIFTAVYTHA
jgi:hypothetical protein